MGGVGVRYTVKKTAGSKIVHTTLSTGRMSGSGGRGGEQGLGFVEQRAAGKREGRKYVCERKVLAPLLSFREGTGSFLPSYPTKLESLGLLERQGGSRGKKGKKEKCISYNNKVRKVNSLNLKVYFHDRRGGNPGMEKEGEGNGEKDSG